MPKRAQKHGQYLKVLKRCTVADLHQLQKYCLNMSSEQLAYLDVISRNDDPDFVPTIELTQDNQAVLAALREHCDSPVQLARRVRALRHISLSIKTLFNTLSTQKMSWNVLHENLQVVDVEESEPEESVSERPPSERSVRETPESPSPEMLSAFYAEDHFVL